MDMDVCSLIAMVELGWKRLVMLPCTDRRPDATELPLREPLASTLASMISSYLSAPMSGFSGAKPLMVLLQELCLLCLCIVGVCRVPHSAITLCKSLFSLSLRLRLVAPLIETVGEGASLVGDGTGLTGTGVTWVGV